MRFGHMPMAWALGAALTTASGCSRMAGARDLALRAAGLLVGAFPAGRAFAEDPPASPQAPGL
jgi:hypothetical protein